MNENTVPIGETNPVTNPDPPAGSSGGLGSAGNSEAGTNGSSCGSGTGSSAWQRGADEARRAAEHAVPLIKSAAREASYCLGYGLAFSVVFAYTVVKEFAPGSFKSGCVDGADAGRTSAEGLRKGAAAAVDPAASSPAAEAPPIVT